MEVTTFGTRTRDSSVCCGSQVSAGGIGTSSEQLRLDCHFRSTEELVKQKAIPQKSLCSMVADCLGMEMA